MPADAGIRFGQYVLVRRIARGGMAEVFLAQQRGLEGFDRRVAVKRILPHLADSPDFVKMFFAEAKLAAQLSHPNVVHIYEFGKVDNDYFIAMEFVEGVHAGQLFKHGEQERLPPTLVARIGADAANALHYAHELRGGTGQVLGLVHRDVSPANIMVSFDGVVKLCDFGIAKAAAAGDQLTNPGQVKGKYAYMSPEQTVAGQLDGRSDVFSLAIVLWELLTGRYIVSRGDAVAAMRSIRDGKLEPIEKACPGIPPPLAHAITWALDPKREKRATALDLGQALEAFLKSAPELATSMQLGGWIRARFPRDNTGQIPALDAPGGARSPGTQMSPGTVAAPGTAASPSTLAVPGTAVPRAVTELPPTPDPDGRLTILTPDPDDLGPRGSMLTPGYPQRRVVRLVDNAEGTEIYSTADLDAEAAETIKGARPHLPGVSRPSEPTMFERPKGATNDRTQKAPSPFVDEDAAELVPRKRKAPDEEDSEGFATILRDGHDTVPSPEPTVPLGDSAARALADSAARSLADSAARALADSAARARGTSGIRPRPDAVAPPLADSAARRDTGPRPMPDVMARAHSSNSGVRTLSESAARSLSDSAARVITPDSASAIGSGIRGAIGEPTWRNTALPTEAASKRRTKVVIAFAALAGLAFGLAVIAMAPKKDKAQPAAVPQDATRVVMSADAGLTVEPITVDAAAEPVEPAVEPTVDAAIAAPTVDEKMAYLIVRTIPDGGTIKVGDQSRLATVQPGDPTGAATAQLVLAPGRHVVTAQLNGYRPEKRDVVLEPGVQQKIEITFTKKLVSRPERGPAPGMLTVRTTPWSDVYLGGKKLGQAPFADLELPAGTHTLTFKNPCCDPVKKTVTIKAGKPVKLNFSLPPP